MRPICIALQSLVLSVYLTENAAWIPFHAHLLRVLGKVVPVACEPSISLDLDPV
jgi:hypothetical protein